MDVKALLGFFVKKDRLPRCCQNVDLEEGNKDKQNMKVLDKISENRKFIQNLERRVS